MTCIRQNLCLSWIIPALTLLATFWPAQAQLNESCTAGVLNRNIQVSPDGTFAIPNVPADRGFFRVGVTCSADDGTIVAGQSELFVPVANGVVPLGDITLGVIEPIPTAIEITALNTNLASVGETTGLTVTGTLPDSSSKELTQQSTGTSYASSNSAIGASSVASPR